MSNVGSVTMVVKYRFSLRCLFFSKKFLLFVSLLFMVMLVSSHAFMVSGSFSVSEIDVVVNSEVGLLKAIRAAPVDETSYVIGFSKDIVLKKSLEIPDGKNITLTSFGGDVAWRLVGANNQNTINVLGFLVIGGIVVTHAENGYGRGVYVESKGTLSLVGGEISGNVINESGGGVYNMGNFEMSEGMISDNNASEGGGVYNYLGNFTMFGGVISGNTALYGGGVCNFDGLFIMHGDKISNNTALYGGGGVCNIIPSHGLADACFVMYGGEISGNAAESYCGGVYYQDDDVFKWVGGVISDNTVNCGDGDADVSNIMPVSAFALGELPATDGDGGEWFDFLLVVGLAVVVVVVGCVVGLFFYRLKKQKNSESVN